MIGSQHLDLPTGYLEHYGLQLKPAGATAGPDADPQALQETATRGTSGAGGPLPYLPQIQRSFGHHDVSGIQSHSDPGASAAAEAIGAQAFAIGDRVAFAGTPSLHTAAHEAAHVVQQRAGVHLQGGVGQAGDQYERHADAVADLVVQGQSSEALLDAHAGTKGGQGIQRAVQRYAGAHDNPAGTVRHYTGAQVDSFLVGSAAISSYLQARISGGQVLTGHVHFYNTHDFTEAWVQYAMRRANPATGRAYTEAEARAWVPRAFTEEPEIHINENAGEPRTAIHEGIHLYEAPALAARIGFWAREGVCEYFAQIVIGEQNASARAGQNPALAQPLASARRLAAASSRDAVARAFFSGDVAGLETAIDAAKGAGTFGRWVGFMNRSTPDYASADALLR
jgi:hypothetical protein